MEYLGEDFQVPYNEHEGESMDEPPESPRAWAGEAEADELSDFPDFMPSFAYHGSQEEVGEDDILRPAFDTSAWGGGDYTDYSDAGEDGEEGACVPFVQKNMREEIVIDGDDSLFGTLTSCPRPDLLSSRWH